MGCGLGGWGEGVKGTSGQVLIVSCWEAAGRPTDFVSGLCIPTFNKACSLFTKKAWALAMFSVSLAFLYCI
jgi:hypothetical protein